jgi:hypothetical protein
MNLKLLQNLKIEFKWNSAGGPNLARGRGAHRLVAQPNSKSSWAGPHARCGAGAAAGGGKVDVV